MNATEMIGLMNREPFSPLEIRLNDGTSIHVDQPYMIAINQNRPTCIVYSDEGKTHFISYRNIAEVVLQDTPTNGA